jgi:hypothetical protein
MEGFSQLRELFRLAKEGLQIVDKLGFVRAQGQAKKDCGTERIAHTFGFETESVMKNYGLGGQGDYEMYRRIF